MSATGQQTLPWVAVTQGATTRRLPVQVRTGRGGEVLGPVPVGRQPKMAFPAPLAIAAPDAAGVRRNYDIDEVILTDWSRGQGVDRYPALGPPSGYQYGDNDSRTAGYLTPPPLPTDLGLGGTPSRFLAPYFADARLLGWYPGTWAYRYDPSPAGWTILSDGVRDLAWYDACAGLGQVFGVGNNGPTWNVWRSTDGVTWTALGLGAMTSPQQCAVFDEKLFVLDAPVATAGTATLYTSADAATGAPATWTAGNSFRTTGQEGVLRLLVWMYPPDRGKPTLWCLTTTRLLYYDYYAATPTWREFYRFRPDYTQYGRNTIGDALVWPKNGNLYTCAMYDEFVTEFTGNAVTKRRFNNGGGLPESRRLAGNYLGADDEFLYVFCGVSAANHDAPGAVVAMQEGGAFHPVYRPTTAGYQVRGGGVAANELWVATDEGGGSWRMRQIATTDVTLAPHLTTLRTYASGSYTTYSGWIDGHLVNTNKRALYFEVDCLKADGTPGLDTGCTVAVAYRGRGDAAFSAAGTLAAASTFPAVLPISGGYPFKELQVAVTLTRGGTTTQAPILKALKLGYRPQPKVRHTYTFRLDLRDEAPAFRTPDRTFFGQSAAQLRAFVLGLADNDPQDALVALSYGGRGNSLAARYTSVPQAEVLVSSQESPDAGDGLFLLTCSDVSAPASG